MSIYKEPTATKKQPIDLARVKTTRGKFPFEIFKVDNEKIFGRVQLAEGNWRGCDWSKDGNWSSFGQAHPYDLVEEPKIPHINIVKSGCELQLQTILFTSREDADKLATQNRSYCVPLTPELLAQYKV